MRVLHVISGLSRRGGGPSRSSQGLVAALCEAGVDAWLYSFDGAEPWIEGVRKFAQGLTTQALKHFDLVHLHCIWDWRIHKVAVLCRKTGIPYVIAPRGMLEPWSLKQKWLKKRLARFLYQDRDLRLAAALHATAPSEADQFRKLGFKNKIIISPNGVNAPSHLSPPSHPSHPSHLPPLSHLPSHRALFVSRMHPKKGVLELVEAWKVLKGEMSGKGEMGGEGERGEKDERGEDWVCELVYTVSGEVEKEYESKVLQRILDLGMSYQDKDGTIHSTTTTSNYDFILTGALDDNAKWDAYARADLFVLPTYSENFGIVVAEALWVGVPVITTKGTPWAELECEERCGWWIDVGVEPLVVALKEAVGLSTDQLRAMGKRGRALVDAKYTWQAAAKQMLEGYADIQG